MKRNRIVVLKESPTVLEAIINHTLIEKMHHKSTVKFKGFEIMKIMKWDICIPTAFALVMEQEFMGGFYILRSFRSLGNPIDYCSFQKRKTLAEQRIHHLGCVPAY